MSLNVNSYSEYSYYLDFFDDIYMNSEIYGDKWAYEFCMDDVYKYLPDIKIIYIHRDPRSVVDSLVKHGMASNFSEALGLWVESILAWKSWSSKYLSLEIYQRDLVLNQKTICASLSTFLNYDIKDLDIIETELESVDDFKNRTLNVNFLQSFPKSSFSKIALDLMDELGYL